MKKVIVFLAAILCLGISTQTLAAVPPVEFQVELTDAKSEFFTVEVKGDAYQRGFQHGKALRKVIRPTINRFKYDMISVFLEAMGTELKWKDYRDFFYNNTGLLKNAQKYAPELVREIQGIADGAGLDFKDVFVYNLNFDETFLLFHHPVGFDSAVRQIGRIFI